MAVLGAIFKVAGGYSARDQAKREASRLEDMGRIAQQEAQVEAQNHAIRVRKFEANQKSAFLKNGVTLDGSPLLVLEDTLTTGQAEVDSIVKRGDAQSRLYSQRATQTRNMGRAQLISAWGGAASDLYSNSARGAAAGV